MNINLIYQNSSFSFDLRKDVTIKYIENITTKLINKDKSFFNLIYEDIILSDTPNSLLRNIVKEENNIPIIISPKTSNGKPKNSNILPKLKSCNHSSNNNTESYVTNNNLLSNETELSQSFSEKSIKALQRLNKHSQTNRGKKKTEYTTGNVVFEEVYNSKDNEFLSLLKILSQKIKEYDNYLYREYKNSFNKNNNKLLLYEKNVLEFKDKQIKFMKNLIDLFVNEEKNFLEHFYQEIKQYNNKDIIMNYKNKINRLESKMLTSIPVVEKKANSNKELPLLLNSINNCKIQNKLLHLSQKIPTNSIDVKENGKKSVLNNENEKNKISLLPTRNKENIFNNISLQEHKHYTIDNIISIQNKNKYKNKNSLKKNSTTNATTNANTNQSENSTFSKPQEKAVVINMPQTPKKTNDVNNKKNKKNNNNNKTENNNSNNEITESYKRVNTIENIKYNQNKVSTLFEISESNNNEKKDSMSSDSSENNNSDEKDKRKSNNNILFNYFEDIKSLKNNLKNKKSINDNDIRNSKIGYLVKSKNKRSKKLGINANDFLI